MSIKNNYYTWTHGTTPGKKWTTNHCSDDRALDTDMSVTGAVLSPAILREIRQPRYPTKPSKAANFTWRSEAIQIKCRSMQAVTMYSAHLNRRGNLTTVLGLSKTKNNTMFKSLEGCLTVHLPREMMRNANQVILLMYSQLDMFRAHTTIISSIRY